MIHREPLTEREKNKPMLRASTLCFFFSFFFPPDHCVCFSLFLLSTSDLVGHRAEHDALRERQIDTPRMHADWMYANIFGGKEFSELLWWGTLSIVAKSCDSTFMLQKKKKKHCLPPAPQWSMAEKVARWKHFQLTGNACLNIERRKERKKMKVQHSSSALCRIVLHIFLYIFLRNTVSHKKNRGGLLS